MQQFRGQVALITGAASGIGREIARQFATAQGLAVIADINGEGAQQVCEEIRDQGGQALPLLMDVTSESSVNEGVSYLMSKLGQLDILVSNAGQQIVAPVVDYSFADWQAVLAVHLDGAFLTTRACLKHMYKARHGRIIYMGSAHSKLASVMKGPYVTAKHGLLGLCRVVAKEGAEYNVTANVVCPGVVRTPLVEKQIPALAKEMGISEDAVVRHVMLNVAIDGRFTAVEDVARAVLYFAGSPTNALTGQSLVVSHGWYMQ